MDSEVPAENSNSPNDNSLFVIKIEGAGAGKVKITLSDSSFFFILKSVQQDHVFVQDCINDVKQNALINLSEKKEAEIKALQLIARAPHSEKMLFLKLLKRGLSREAAAHALIRLKELNYLDDRQFAYDWVQYQAEYKLKGRALLKAELLNKGVSRQITEEILNPFTAEKEKELALKLLSKLRANQTDIGPKQLSRKLLNRGFSMDVIRACLREAGIDGP